MSRVKTATIWSRFGATPSLARQTVIVEALLSDALGIAVGLLAGALASPSLSKFLYGVQPADPVILTVAALAISWVVVAARIPASKGTRLQPSAALQVE